jgi:hypothetical protein
LKHLALTKLLKFLKLFQTLCRFCQLSFSFFLFDQLLSCTCYRAILNLQKVIPVSVSDLDNILERILLHVALLVARHAIEIHGK